MVSPALQQRDRINEGDSETVNESDQCSVSVINPLFGDTVRPRDLVALRSELHFITLNLYYLLN